MTQSCWATCNLEDIIPLGNSACVEWPESGTRPHWPIQTDKSYMHHFVNALTSVDLIRSHHNERIHRHLGKRNIELILDFWVALTGTGPDSNRSCIHGLSDTHKHFQKQSWWTIMNTELVTQQSLQCQVFVGVFKISYNNIIIKFDFVRQVCFAQSDNEKYLCRVTNLALTG